MQSLRAIKRDLPVGKCWHPGKKMTAVNYGWIRSFSPIMTKGKGAGKTRLEQRYCEIRIILK